MERAYREDELTDALIVDSEGYIYGKVERIEVKEDEIDLRVYESKPDERTIADIDTIKEELLKRVNLTFASKLQRLSSSEVLAQDIRKELGLKLEEPLTDQHYMKYAEGHGIEILHKKVAEERKEPKGTINLHEVKTIKITTIGTGERAVVTKIILLHEPKEAKFRKIPLQKEITYRRPEILRDKLVIDSSGLAVGYVDSIVLFHDTPGIRIYTSKPTDSVSLSWLFQYLEESGRPDIKESIKKYFGTESGFHVYRVTMDDLEEFMKKTKTNFKVPEKVFIEQRVKEFLMDIPWEMISRIGDVVLIRLTLSELKSKGY